MTTQATTLDQLKQELGAALPPLDDDDRRSARTLVRLLAQGDPVEPERFASALGRSTPDAAKAIAGLPLVIRDDAERVVGFWGLSVVEMPHRLRADGRNLYTWCAWDTLFLPVALGEQVGVESTCPTTAQPITLTVSPEGVSDVHPSGAVMSFLLSGEEGFSGDVIRGFCHFVHFFASEDAARTWTAEREGTFQLSITDGFDLGRFWATRAFGSP
ncbi:MAG: organomercurial lyase [Solirubrobacterales bacterium]